MKTSRLPGGGDTCAVTTPWIIRHGLRSFWKDAPDNQKQEALLYGQALMEPSKNRRRPERDL